FQSVRGDFKFGNNGFPIQGMRVMQVVKDDKGRLNLKTIATPFKSYQDVYHSSCPLQDWNRFFPRTQSTEPKRTVTSRALSFVRPAWAHSCGCKSRHKLITANEVKRNCTRATECGKEAWNVSCEPMNKNRIRGAAKQGERARNREALVIKAKRRISGGCAVKERS